MSLFSFFVHHKLVTNVIYNKFGIAYTLTSGFIAPFTWQCWWDCRKRILDFDRAAGWLKY